MNWLHAKTECKKNGLCSIAVKQEKVAVQCVNMQGIVERMRCMCVWKIKHLPVRRDILR